MKCMLRIALVLCFACPLLAQLPAKNADGVSAGHHIFRAKDVDAANKFRVTLTDPWGTSIEVSQGLNAVK